MLALMTLTLVIVGAVLRPADDTPPADAAAVAATGDLNRKLVLVISVDGLTKKVFRKMGRDEIPHMWRMMNRGVSTRNARTEPELTFTLPNHVGMVTGRRINASRGGHGVTWNWDDTSLTVHDGAGERVRSVFNEVSGAGGSTAVFAAKDKFSIFERSWPRAVHKSVIREGDDAGVTWRMRRHLRREKPSFTFLHLGGPDKAGHRHGWMSPGYKRAVRKTDALIGKVLKTRANHRKLKRKLAIVFTSDHGGVPGTTSHSKSTRRANYQVPFAIFARYVDKGTNIYQLSPAYARPRRACWCSEDMLPPQRTDQPVRNGDVANVSLDILGLGPVGGSLWGTEQQLNWR